MLVNVFLPVEFLMRFRRLLHLADVFVNIGVVLKSVHRAGTFVRTHDVISLVASDWLVEMLPAIGGVGMQMIGHMRAFEARLLRIREPAVLHVNGNGKMAGIRRVGIRSKRSEEHTSELQSP